jgi:hypothetical protein
MSGNKYIKQVFACIVLIVFAIGITPKKYLHDIFAKHEDTRRVSDHTSTTISKSGYNCNCDDQVAESNFLHPLPNLEIILPCISSSTGILKITFSSLPKYYTSLRGPPVMI